MDLTEAIERVEEIHAHIAKGEVYRGYRPVPVALTGVVGLLAAACQSHLVPRSDDARAFLVYWVVVAGVNAGLNAVIILLAYRHADPFARRHSRRVVGQFLPSGAAGIAITAALLIRDARMVQFLPGIWAMLFGLGLFASRPYLPRATGWVALAYVLAGAMVLLHASPDFLLAGYAVGLVFGIGQLAAAAVLYADLPRPDDD